jgi:hypothetical protein
MHLQQSAYSSSDYQRLALLPEDEEDANKHDGSKAMDVISKGIGSFRNLRYSRQTWRRCDSIGQDGAFELCARELFSR